MDEKKNEIKELARLHREFSHALEHLFGYTISSLFDYSKLFKFLKFPINNIGDPFSKPSNLKINTLKIEKKVIDRLAKLFHLKNNEHWGYVTNGGTEGNLYGLYLSRELYPDGLVFLSDQTHYSAIKSIRLLRMPFVMVPSQDNGEINYRALEEKIVANRDKGTPVFFVNIGTTMRGAVDDLRMIHQMISRLKIQKYYIHCDAAFYGMVLPFIPELKPFDFRAGIDSIAISGHKMIGSPIPCGAVITKKSYVDKIATSIEYVGIKDTTISGSRNGITPLFLWHELIYTKNKEFKKKVLSCFEKANYIIESFNKKGIHAWRNPGSLTIVLPCPSKKLAKKWQLPTQGNICCMIALPQLKKNKIDQFIQEYAKDV